MDRSDSVNIQIIILNGAKYLFSDKKVKFFCLSLWLWQWKWIQTFNQNRSVDPLAFFAG